MGIDIVDIGLSSITDFMAFERLATEIMQAEGFSKIKPLGVRDDKGVDAIQEKFYQDLEITSTVFQFTTQEYLIGKVRETIRKLQTNKIVFAELVIVTNREISASRIDEIKHIGRKEFHVRVDIYDKKTLSVRLADFDNGIFVRHFPRIEDQIGILQNKALLLSQPATAAHEIAFMRVSCALSYHGKTNQARRDMFDNLLLAAISCSSAKSMSVHEIVESVNGYVPCLSTTIDQVKAGLDRLRSRSYVRSSEQIFSVDSEWAKMQATSITSMNEATEALLADIVESVGRSGTKLAIEDRKQIMLNTRTALTELLRLTGLDMAIQFTSIQKVTPGDPQGYLPLIAIAKSKLPAQVGDALVSVLSDLLSNPTEDQAKVLACWCRTFIGAQLMMLDPTLNQFQLSKLSSKHFILDTDCVLDAIVTDTPKSQPSIALFKTLIDLGCKVAIPTNVLKECASHAAHSFRTYNYFGEAGSHMSAEFIEEKVQNVFVKGYFYGLQNGSVRQGVSYRDYLLNYYEPNGAEKFMQEVIETILPEGVRIASCQDLAGHALPDKELQALKQYFLEELTKSRKADYRTIEQTKELATTDAELFLLVFEMNRKLGREKEKVLG
jgi:hypothetical protein